MKSNKQNIPDRWIWHFSKPLVFYAEKKVLFINLQGIIFELEITTIYDAILVIGIHHDVDNVKEHGNACFFMSKF